MKNGTRGFTHVILILVGVVLILLLFGFFAVKHSVVSTNTNPYQVPERSRPLKFERPTHLPCGITVLDPMPNQQVQMPITVRGYINGCGWNNAPITVGYVKILNERGQLISAEYPLLRKDSNFNLPAYFETTIPSILGDLQTSTVHIYISSDHGRHPSVVDVPVSF